MEFHDILNLMAQKKASDLFITVGRPPCIKVDGHTPQSASTVCFSELEIADVMKRVVTVVRFARQDMHCPANYVPR